MNNGIVVVCGAVSNVVDAVPLLCYVGVWCVAVIMMMMIVVLLFVVVVVIYVRLPKGAQSE